MAPSRRAPQTGVSREDSWRFTSEDAVKIMTVLRAKGPEFPVVFLRSPLEGRPPLGKNPTLS